MQSTIGGLRLANPVICGSSETGDDEAGIRTALRAGAAGVIAKSVNERPAAARQLGRADYAQLDAAGAPVAHGVSLLPLRCLTAESGGMIPGDRTHRSGARGSFRRGQHRAHGSLYVWQLDKVGSAIV